MKSNDNIPEDEMILAELIAAASEHGLVGCKGARFRTRDGTGFSSPVITSRGYKPPPGAVACCALGAQSLSASDFHGISDWFGNDAHRLDKMPADFLGKADSDWNISAAFNLAMDPSNEE